MRTSRRTFFRGVGVGAAGLGLSAALPAEGASPQPGEGTAVGPHGKEMWPYKSQLKATRIKFDVPQNQISWAYMKEVRENNKTRKVYPINPYVEVYQYRDNLYELFTQNCFSVLAYSCRRRRSSPHYERLASRKSSYRAPSRPSSQYG